MKEKIWQQLAATDYDGFFITAEFAKEDNSLPTTLNAFICQKMKAIKKKRNHWATIYF